MLDGKEAESKCPSGQGRCIEIIVTVGQHCVTLRNVCTSSLPELLQILAYVYKLAVHSLKQCNIVNSGNRRIRFKWILKKEDRRSQTGFIWHRIRTRGGLL